MNKWTWLSVNLYRLNNLKELNIYSFDSTMNIETLAMSLTKLEQLSVVITGANSILPFIRHSKKLKIIKIVLLAGKLNLIALNEERKKLENACKITIHVNDNGYLSSKSKSNNLYLELDLVKITRHDHVDIASSF